MRKLLVITTTDWYKFFITMALCTFAITSCGNKEPRAEYSGKDISNDVGVIRAKTTKDASVQIYTKGLWKLYAGTSVDDIDLLQPIAEGKDSGTFAINVPNNVRSYFLIETEEGKAILSDRHLPMEGGYNFRDLGGYRTTDGQYVKWGRIFRSDDLHNLTEDDLGYLSSIPLVAIVDFRSEDERSAAPDKNPESVRENYKYSITPGNLMDAVKADLQNITEMKADTLMMGMNELLVSDSACINQYRKFFELLQNEENIPLMFHCSAGKDRTGMAAALVLFSLGVDEQTIINDYLLSNKYLANKYAKYKVALPALSPLFEVKPQFLKAGIDRIKKDHGSVENYLTEVLNVDLSKMRNKYLY